MKVRDAILNGTGEEPVAFTYKDGVRAMRLAFGEVSHFLPPYQPFCGLFHEHAGPALSKTGIRHGRRRPAIHVFP